MTPERYRAKRLKAARLEVERARLIIAAERKQLAPLLRQWATAMKRVAKALQRWERMVEDVPGYDGLSVEAPRALDAVRGLADIIRESQLEPLVELEGELQKQSRFLARAAKASQRKRVRRDAKREKKTARRKRAA